VTSRARAVTLAALIMLSSLASVLGTPDPSRGPATASAQTVTEPLPEGPARISVVAIDLAVGPAAAGIGRTDGIGWTLLVENAGDATWSRIEVIAEVHGALGSRSALRAALGGGTVPPLVARTVVPAPGGPLGSGGILRIDGVVPLSGALLSSPTNAVLPLRLRVLADGGVVGRIDTAVVRLGSTPVAPVATSLVWPVTAPPLRDPTGTVAGSLDPLTAPGGHLDTLVSALGTGPDGAAWDGVALAAGLHLIEDLALRATGPQGPSGPPGASDESSPDAPFDAGVAEPADPSIEGPVQDVVPPGPVAADADLGALRAAELLRRIRTVTLALPNGPVVTPYADADLGRLIVSGPALQPLAARSVLEGARRTAALLGRPNAPVVLLHAPVSASALDLLASSTVLLPYDAIEAPDLALDVPLGEAVRSLRSPTGRVLTAVIGDPYLSAALGTSSRSSPGDPVLAAHEVLVRTAMIHLEAPGREGRSVLLLPPEDFDPDPRFAATLLTGLDAAPWLTLRSPAALVSASAEEREPVSLAESVIDPLPSRLVDALRRTRRDLELLVEATDGLPDELDPRVGGRDLQAANDELMRAVSRSLPSGTETALALLEGVRAGVTSAFGVVGIAATDVTLTDRDGIVPLTVVRTGGVAIRVRVEVTGPSALTWPDGRVRDLVVAPDATGSLEIPVRSGPTGRFPVTVRVTDPTGERVLATETLSVRATAVAGPALALISALVALLVVVGTARQRRRGPSVAAARPTDGPRG
jgi:hypothetical protein